MLSEQEKKELLEDGLSQKRRAAFLNHPANEVASRSLDEFVRYLDSVQKIFEPFSVSKRKIITQQNKL